jgi:hypothetical protein
VVLTVAFGSREVVFGFGWSLLTVGLGIIVEMVPKAPARSLAVERRFAEEFAVKNG